MMRRKIFLASLVVVAVLKSSVVISPISGDEYLDRWTPGGDTNAADLPYPHRFAPYERETETDWIDDRWQRMDKGPFVTHSILLPGYEVGPKVLAVQANAGKFLLYDLAGGSFVAGVTAGELRTDAARFGLLNRPQLLGDVAFVAPAVGLWRTELNGTPIPAAKCDYQGLYLHGERVVLATHIDGVEVLESTIPGDEKDALTREIDVGPHAGELWLTLCEAAEPSVIGASGERAEWTDGRGQKRFVAIASADQEVRIEAGKHGVMLRFPSTTGRSSARIVYSNDAARLAVVESSRNRTSLAALRTPGPKRWGAPIETSGELANDGESAYVVDRITVPHENSFGALFFLAGLAFFPNGDAAVCTAHGDVWIVRGIDVALQHVTWQRFATGLYQPLGLEVVDDQVYILGRDQITRLHDNNQDGEADFYESFNHDVVIHGWPHAYAMRLDRAPDGSFLFLKSGDPPHGSALLRLSSNGEKLEVVARGFRHPFGLGVGPGGEITVADNEGNWVPSSKIDLIQSEGNYGFLGSAVEQSKNPLPARPLCYLPKVADNSCGGQFWHTSPRWGPFNHREMFHLSWGRCTMHGVLRQQVGNTWQAATVEVPGVKFEAGPAEAAFSSRDGQLYVVGLDGWQTAAKADGSFERVRYTGKPARLPTRFAAHADGIVIGFEEALDPAVAEDVSRYRVEQWNYRWGPTYGSYHYCLSDPKRVGHDVAPIESASLSPDGKELFLRIPGLCPVDQLQLAYDVRALDGAEVRGNLYATVNALAPAYNGAAPHQPLTGRDSAAQLLAKENLVAWCIVPFDAKKRNSEERAAMLAKLGIRRIAYDWRDEHVPTFDEELEAYSRHGIKLHAFWMPIGTKSPLKEAHWPLVLDLVKRHQFTPELWVMLNDGLLSAESDSERAEGAAEILAPTARAAGAQGCRIGLYNHGGWWGEPDNQIRVIEVLRSMKIENVGIVYNFHHGHKHVADFANLARRMEPYLMTVNVNGMRDGGPKIFGFGQGDHETAMLEALAEAGYRGPIGVLGHREEMDAEESLRENLRGFEALRQAE